jgi:hypothetical protein
MNLLNDGISRISAVVFACAMLCFALLVQAKPVPDAPPFDHSKTGFLLRDVHFTLKCEQCHVDGIFKNTPKECAGCHTTGTRVAAKPKPINHVPTNSACDACHVIAANFLVTSYDHFGITGNCALCHNGQSLGVMSKPVNHFPTSLPCESCHTNTSSFLITRMDHTGVTTGCAICHGGQFKKVVNQYSYGNHIPAYGQDCGSCHTGYTTFLGAVYNHAGVAANSCDGCHNGTFGGVRSKSANHIPTPGGTFCDTCHTSANTNSYTTFQGALLHSSYAVPSGGCYNCHNGAYLAANAQPRPATHIPGTATNPITQSCDACHTSGSYTSFSLAGFHTIAANNAAIASGPCSTCHNGSYTGWTSSNGMYPQAKSASHIITSQDCYTCHSSANTSNYTTFLGAGMHGIAANNVGIAGTCGKAGCHDGSGTGGAFGHPITAVHNAIGINCDLCHTVQLTLNYTTFLGATYNHNTPPGVCSTCHNGSSAKGKPAAHIPTSMACDQCHALPPPSGPAIDFTGATFHSSPASGTAAGVCQTCHTGSYTTYSSGNGLVPQAKSVPHIPATGSCDACHTSSVTIYNSATGFLGAGYSHVGVAAGGCATCHSGAYPGVDSKTMCYGTGGSGAGCPTVGAFAHQATSAPCDQCHNTGASLNYTTWANAGYVHTGADAGQCAKSGCHAAGGYGKGISANHFPTTLSCDSGGCHTYTTGTFANGQLVHSVVATKRCDSCHNGSYNAFGATGAVPKVSNHIPTAITGSLDCNTCHTGTTPSSAAGAVGGSALWAKGTALGETMNHNGAPGGAPYYCVTCHLTGTPYLVPSGFKRKNHEGASTSKDCSSSKCHKPLGKEGTTYISW